MKLADKISINTQYTRSTNIERDRDSQAIVKAYLPTSRGVTVLNEVAVALGNQDQPRAWSLIGPYGSGKSSFALFLNHLLGESSSPIGKTALRVMEKRPRSAGIPVQATKSVVPGNVDRQCRTTVCSIARRT